MKMRSVTESLKLVAAGLVPPGLGDDRGAASLVSIGRKVKKKNAVRRVKHQLFRAGDADQEKERR